MQHFDIAVVGGGMVGLSLAMALRDLPVKIALVNRGPLITPLSDEPELRVSAINEVNRRTFASMGIWQRIPGNRVCDYQHMHVWDQDSFGRIQFDAQSLSVPQLGAIVENQALINALAGQVSTQTNITVFDNANIKQLALGEQQHAVVVEDGRMLTASLLVGADGAHSTVRKTAQFEMNLGEYGQQAIVATVRTEAPHGNTARQVFTPFGPLALLPLADPHLCSIVWSQDTVQANRLKALEPQAFNKDLFVACNGVLGHIELVSETAAFPLHKQYARQWVSEGVVLCGDAAHTFHPLAGQGANLGFADAWMLAQTLSDIAARQGDYRDVSAFRVYERGRKTAAVKMLATMESFHQLFTGTNNIKKGIRGLGLLAANAIAPIKQTLAKEALGI